MQCPDCPSRVNQPQTIEGWQVWDLVQRCGGQLRVGGGMAPQVLGFDMTAVLAMAQALSVPGIVVAELLPGVERAMVEKLSERQDDPDHKTIGML